MIFRLGKKPARPGATRLRFAAYLRPTLPVPPAEFGYEGELPADCGMLANDRFGDCVWAGAAHETMLWDQLAGAAVAFSDEAVLADYATVTGFDPDDPATDQGTDVQRAASYRRQIGVVDAAGERHRIGAYVALKPGDLDEHKVACLLFGAVGVGLSIGDNQIAQFLAGAPWDGGLGGNAGGHYVPLVGYRDGHFLVVTFGRIQRIAPAFLQANEDEALAYLSEEMVAGGKQPTGFDLATLRADLAAVATG